MERSWSSQIFDLGEITPDSVRSVLDPDDLKVFEEWYNKRMEVVQEMKERAEGEQEEKKRFEAPPVDHKCVDAYHEKVSAKQLNATQEEIDDVILIPHFIPYQARIPSAVRRCGNLRNVNRSQLLQAIPRLIEEIKYLEKKRSQLNAHLCFLRNARDWIVQESHNRTVTLPRAKIFLKQTEEQVNTLLRLRPLWDDPQMQEEI